MFRDRDTMKSSLSLVAAVWAIIIVHPEAWQARACLEADLDTLKAKVVDCNSNRGFGPNGVHPDWVGPVIKNDWTSCGVIGCGGVVPK